MKIFIAGGTGFVGGHLTAELLKRGHELVLLSHARNAGSASGGSHLCQRRCRLTRPAMALP
jgi:nucleoside-diphosphate-sugar epimerase